MRPLVLTPSVWREHEWSGTVVTSLSPLELSALPLPSACRVVQHVRTRWCAAQPIHSELGALLRFPNLRRIIIRVSVLSPLAASLSLAPLSNLSRLGLHTELLHCSEMRQLCTLPALASLSMSWHRCETHGGESDLFHALAAKPSWCTCRCCHTSSPHVMDNLPVWPHERCLVGHNPLLCAYTFVNVAARFPSLTSLNSPSASDETIARLIQLPNLVELRFAELTATSEVRGIPAPSTDVGFRALRSAPLLRSVQFPYACEALTPTFAAVSSLSTLTLLARLTLPAWWLGVTQYLQLFSQHHFAHLRCLELIKALSSSQSLSCDAFLPFVKPAHVLVAGREQRQAARASVKLSIAHTADPADVCVISVGNAANFPVLECICPPPYNLYHVLRAAPSVESGWLRQQLRRSYEYEVAKEWEAECVTLGEAELLKTVS